jgi:glutamate-1-semialdehyde 2,1-aminomutase
MAGSPERHTRSRRIMVQAEVVMPGGVNSPVRAFKVVGGTPVVIERGEGAYLFDVDRNRYLDFCCSWGPLILGHADPDVVSAVKAQIDRGTTFGAATELEYQLAKFIVDRIEAVEKIRFVSSGTEAVMSTVRLARGFTGRDLILKFDGCYHGHADHLLVAGGSGLATFGKPSSAGVPEAFSQHTAALPLDDEASLRRFFAERGDKLAAVIIEGVPANSGLLIQHRDYMKLLRELTDKHGALLILDEVITGFRLGMGGAAAHYQVRPDLVTYGKVIGGGFPVGAFGGRSDIMDMLAPLGPVYQAGTLSGNPVAMTAGLTTLQKLERERVYAALDARAARFAADLRSRLSGRGVEVVSLGSIFWLTFQPHVPRAAHEIEAGGIARYNRLHRAWLEAGLYLPPSGYEVCFISAAHGEAELREAAEKIAEVIDRDAE